MSLRSNKMMCFMKLIRTNESEVFTIKKKTSFLLLKEFFKLMSGIVKQMN